jgi:hypothetical protein
MMLGCASTLRTVSAGKNPPIATGDRNGWKFIHQPRVYSGASLMFYTGDMVG